MKQETFTDIEYSYRKKKTKREEFLEIMEEIIPWDEWVGVIEPYYPKGKRGRPPMGIEKMLRMYLLQIWFNCALPGFVDSKNEEKTERNAGYLVVSHSGGGMLRQGTRKGIRRTPANRGMRAHWIVKSLDISEDVCHGLCP